MQAIVAPLIDIGINLAHDSFEADRDAVIARARAAGVIRQIVTGATIGGSRAAMQLAQSHADELYATAGVHPHHSREWSAASAVELEELLRQPEVVAVGECGLDYFRNYSPAAVQRHAFAAQLELAQRVSKPVFLHQRDAHADFMAILREHLPSVTAGVAHCFTGSAVELEDYLAAGLHIGITGWVCDERRGRHVHELLPRIPADRLMLETDGPYLLPRDLNPKPAGRRNEPCFLPHIAAVVAQARGETLAQTAAHTTATATRFFDLPTPGNSLT